MKTGDRLPITMDGPDTGYFDFGGFRCQVVVRPAGHYIVQDTNWHDGGSWLELVPVHQARNYNDVGVNYCACWDGELVYENGRMVYFELG